MLSEANDITMLRARWTTVWCPLANYRITLAVWIHSRYCIIISPTPTADCTVESGADPERDDGEAFAPQQGDQMLWFSLFH